jgi:hypothetical protein
MRLPFTPKSIHLLVCAAIVIFLYPVAAFALDPLIISEFRLRGPNGANDEFVEIYNNSDAPVTVATTDGSLGYAVAASNGVVRFIIPNGTVIPARGHYLGVNSSGYSLASYPAGNGTTATGDAAFTTDIPDNAGIALFNTSTPANFSLATAWTLSAHPVRLMPSTKKAPATQHSLRFRSTTVLLALIVRYRPPAQVYPRTPTTTPATSYSSTPMGQVPARANDSAHHHPRIYPAL